MTDQITMFQITSRTTTSTDEEEPSDPPDFLSPANLFLQKEVYRLGTEPGLRSLPPGPERDFLTLTWGPIICRTTYGPETERLLPVFLRSLNDEVRRSLPRSLPGSPKQIEMLQHAYSSKVFNDRELYDGISEADVRGSFHDWKISLALPSIELPARLRVCFMVDDWVLASFTEMANMSMMAEKDTDVGPCPIKAVEENFPDMLRRDDMYKGEEYDGWTTVVLSSLVEIYDGLRKGGCLADFHRPGRVYLGNGEWS